MSRGGYEDRPRSGGFLHPCSNVGSVSEDIRFFPSTRTNHHHARVYSDACRELRSRRIVIELRDSIADSEAGADCTFGVIVMGLRVAEEGHYAVAEILDDVAAEAGYRLGDGALIRGDDIAPFLGVQSRGNLN